ncbi:hypothetical protein BLOT_011137 [Blomia tropicalis]|nr:hypothetical protein BLOT_011137 [Blomia tropicalis]
MAKPVTRSQTREQPEIQDLEEEQPSRPSLIPVAPNMQSFMSTASTSRINEPTSRPNERTPTIRASDLPTFDGKVLNWLPFKMVFSRVVLNEPSISDAQKLGLLIKVTSGRALNRVVALTQRELSTAEIFNSLEDYFHSNTKVEECLSQMVRKLPFVSNYYDLAQFEEMLWQFRDLESICSGLGPEYEARGNAMIGQVLRKFGYELRKDLSTCSTLEEMEEKMTQLYESAMRLTEANDYHRHRSPPNSNVRPPSLSSHERNNHSRHVVASVTASSQCQLCPQSGHTSAECDMDLSPEDKQRLFNAKSLCFKCAEPGHRSNVCPNRNSVRCSVCNLSHPSVLHGVRFSTSRSNQPPQSPEHSSSSTSVVGAVIPLVSSEEQIVAPIQSLSSSSKVCHARYIGVAPPSITIERPAISLNLNNRTIVAWLDPCSPYTMIRKSLIDPSQTFPCLGIRAGGFKGGPIASSSTKTTIVIQGSDLETKIDAYVMEDLPHFDLLIGTDMLPRLSKLDQSGRLKFETVFGDIPFGPVGAVIPMEESDDKNEDMLDKNVIRRNNDTIPFGPIGTVNLIDKSSNDLVNVDESNDVDEDQLNTKVACLDNGMSEVSSPILSDIRPTPQCLVDSKRAFESSGFKLHKIRSNNFSSSQKEELCGMCCFLGESFLIGKSKIAVQDKPIVEKELRALCELIRMVQKIIGILHNCGIYPEVKIFSASNLNVDCLNMNRLNRAVTTKEDTSDPDIWEFFGRSPSSRSMVAWVRKWLSWISDYRTVPSLDRAFIVLYRLFQRVKSPPSNIDNFVEDHGLIRFKSRDGISPVWIPPKTTLARVLLLEAHKEYKHNGCNLSLAQLSPEIVIGNASRSRKTIIHRCIIGRKYRALAIAVPFGPANDIVDLSQGPFSRIAIDGIARSATIRFKGSTLQRPKHGLVPLGRPECEETTTDERGETLSVNKPKPTQHEDTSSTDVTN